MSFIQDIYYLGMLNRLLHNYHIFSIKSNQNSAAMPKIQKVQHDIEVSKA